MINNARSKLLEELSEKEAHFLNEIDDIDYEIYELNQKIEWLRTDRRVAEVELNRIKKQLEELSNG